MCDLRFGVGKITLRRRSKAQDTKDDEDLVLNVAEGGREEQPECEVEQPISDGGDTHASGSSFKRPHFGGVHPRHGRESEGVDDDQQVAESDDGVCCGSSDLDHHVQVAIDASRNICAG